MQQSAPISRLGEERQAITLLLELLKQEQQQLIAAQIDQLGETTAQKALQIAQMTRLAGARHQALAAAGFAASEAGMAAWIGAASDAAGAALWQEVLRLTRAAKECNRLNGMLINKHMVYTRSALNFLRPPALGGNIYGANGYATTGRANRRFVLG